MGTIKLRVDLAGFLGNVANELEQVSHELREAAGYDPKREDSPGAAQDPAPESDWMVGMLREISGHARGVATGIHGLEEFALHYSLADTPTVGNNEPITAIESEP